MVTTNRVSKAYPVTSAHRERFLQMLPQIQRQAAVACRKLDAEAQLEFTQAVVAAAFAAFARLVELDKADLAYPTPLAQFSIRQTRAGRSLGSRLNRRDVTSRYGQTARQVSVERLDRCQRDGQWNEVLVEDHRAGSAETACARIDIGAWFKSLGPRTRRIAWALASGYATGDVAEEFALSHARISQLRSELRIAWLTFQGELPMRLGQSGRVSTTRLNLARSCRYPMARA